MSVLSFSSAPPHGGELKNLMVDDAEERSRIVGGASTKVELNDRQSCDVELLINGGFSPLDGPMNEDVYNHVVDNMRLPESNVSSSFRNLFPATEVHCFPLFPARASVLPLFDMSIENAHQVRMNKTFY